MRVVCCRWWKCAGVGGVSARRTVDDCGRTVVDVGVSRSIGGAGRLRIARYVRRALGVLMLMLILSCGLTLISHTLQSECRMTELLITTMQVSLTRVWLPALALRLRGIPILSPSAIIHTPQSRWPTGHGHTRWPERRYPTSISLFQSSLSNRSVKIRAPLTVRTAAVAKTWVKYNCPPLSTSTPLANHRS